MKRLILSLIAVLWLAAAYPEKFTYNFKTMSLSEALSLIAEEHPQLKLNFIYNDLDNYNVSGRIDTEDGYTALKQLIGLNPVSVIKKGNHIYVEALQHGKFRYYGNVVGNNAEPVVAATVLILAPKDSTVITYGITDNDGRFSIPCDQKDVIGKLSCVGYKTTYRKFNNFNVGSIKMSENPVLLKNVNVTADDARLYSDKSVYLP
ncbi:MAG: carboxypeptidase-like regulatory domain-containing protein, partial [Muribaculaceae bacterium]|nr:carboxypeptidase-like regulatory domain-containing protein [Muribaculaceae bacterium]